MDTVDRETRSRMMSGIRASNTKTEIAVRKALHHQGFRYRINVRSLPGTPDIVLPKYHAVIFVHGCFWHGHDCRLFRLPQTRRDFWNEKIATNRSRDRRSIERLRSLRWRVCIVWECALRGRRQSEAFPVLIDRLREWLISQSAFLEIRDTDLADDGLSYSIENAFLVAAESPGDTHTPE